MSTITSESFQIIGANALERMAFVITDPGTLTPGEVLAQAQFHAAVEIENQACNAWLALSATSGFVQEVAGGMMGMDPLEIDVDAHGDPTIQELANILGGELVMNLGGAERPFRLGLPHPASDEDAGRALDRAQTQGGFACVLSTETGHMLIMGMVD
jgi:hypothetical protein